MKRKAHPVISRLHTARVKQNINQQDLAERIGVTRPALSHWERGWKTPTWFNFMCWAEALGVEIEVKETRHAGEGE